ncbi:MAG: N-acetylmuramoyl-L-alanine amidase [Terriglobales bacterium]
MQTQASTTLTRGGHAFRLGVALLFALVSVALATTRTHNSIHSHNNNNDAWSRQQFAKAERMREALNGRPLGERTRHEYQRVIDSYRRVYFGTPASSKADPSVVATAELMVEMGRRFDDNKILRGAVEQYRFLRKEYPGSKYRFDALFTIGEIYKDDLNDPEEARAAFTDFVHRYPRNRLADDARAAVKEIDATAQATQQTARKTARKQRPSNASGTSASSGNVSGTGGSGASINAGVGVGSNSEDAAESANTADVSRSGLPRVTGVRHWSTPDYTRVAIDVEQEVKFGSQRISHPDRIFFDLRDTKLASTLVGKTFDVDDGFLKKIRVAEFEPGRTRIVLEVDDLASYDAFLLPDPYRLIIDIHGKDLHGKDKHGRQKPATTTMTETATAEASIDSDAEFREPQPTVETKSMRRKAQPQSEKVAVGFVKPGPVETDLPPETVSAGSKSADPAQPVNGIGVIKTTVAVKGSGRKIPKTIVEADDRAPTMTATLEPEKILPKAATNDNLADGGETKAGKSKSRSSSASFASASGSTGPPSSSSTSTSTLHRKRPRSSSSSSSSSLLSSAGGASDTADLHADLREATREAIPTAAGDRSLTRALGLKIGKIVIDAGHGGHDTGTIGPNGLLEKDVVLDVAKRLGRLLESRLGAEVIYTRQDDTFIPLETRTAIANRERADLFISIHANSSRDADARGVETYYLNFTSSPEALEVAARENAVSEKSIHELQDLVKKIALKDKIDESREFAGDVQESLYGGLALNSAGIRNRGIKKAPFIVLIGANMPSILAEISFVSNPTDERKMETSEHRQRIAESLYRGVSKYVNGLSGVKVASKIDKPEGQ